MNHPQTKLPKQIPSSPKEAKTILVVDDESKLRQIIRVGLVAEGFVVLEASDAEEALRICKEHRDPIHLILIDVVLPGMSGLELAPRVVDLRPEIQVILMSGCPDERILLHASLNPNVPFFHKPFTLDALVSKIREMLNVPR